MLPYFSSTGAGYTIYKKNTAVYFNPAAFSNLPGAPTSNWSTILYELTPDTVASTVTTDTKFYTLRDARGLLGTDYRNLPPTDPNFAPATLEISTPSFATNFIARESGGKAVIFSENSPSSIQIANLYGSPLFEGEPTVAGLNTGVMRIANVSSIGVSSIIEGNAITNRDIVYNLTVLSSLYLGNISTISSYRQRLTDGSFNMIIAWPYINSNAIRQFQNPSSVTLFAGTERVPTPPDFYGEYYNCFYDMDISGIFIAYGLGGGGNFNDLYNDVTFNGGWEGCDTVRAYNATAILSSTLTITNNLQTNTKVHIFSNAIYADRLTLNPEPGNDTYALYARSTYTKIVRGGEFHYVTDYSGKQGTLNELKTSSLILSTTLLQGLSNQLFVSSNVSAPSTNVNYVNAIQQQHRQSRLKG